jgi:hypothetical protein
VTSTIGSAGLTLPSFIIERVLFLGGQQGMSPHGYLGIEGMVLQRISKWIRAAGSG